MAETPITKELIRHYVVEALKAASTSTSSPSPSAPATGRKVIALYSGTNPPPPEFLAALPGIGAAGFQVVSAWSFSFCKTPHTGVTSPTALPSDADDEECRRVADSAEALLLPSLTINSAAKVAAGITDSLPTRLISFFLDTGKPVFMAADPGEPAAAFHRRYPGAPPARLHTVETVYKTLEKLGICFVGSALNEHFKAHFFPPRNETPDRLARITPSRKREFITTDEIWAAAAAGQKAITHAPDAIITDEAREQAAARGLALIPTST